eukprot:TRINITY_DN23362_c0_g1_i1.p1 TRINITY_DN23362_c0_g1~~TRINITY_DN23362_c0_g1_i1.p1  ORF type:complete len:453 (+),score=173.60 TRINITY_DN23362_c0_g1_i1:134-1360(+)
MDLYCNETPYSDELGVTLGVKTEHLAFLLCPQHIQEVPESDIITVERFSFHVRYFHIENCLIKHLAIVVCVAGGGDVDVYSSFLDGYSAAVNREQIRSGYLQESVMLLSKRRDMCDEPGGTWSSLYNDVQHSSLVHEIVSMTDSFTEGRKVLLYVNNWLHLESQQPCVTSKPYDDLFTILMVHPSLRQPLEKTTIDQMTDIIKGITLPEILSLLAAPVTVAELKHNIEKAIGKFEQPVSYYPAEQKHYSLKQVTFNKLLAFLINKKIAKVLKTYYVFQSQVFNDAATQSMSKRGTRYAPARVSPPPESEDEVVAGVKLLTGVKEERRVKSTALRQQVEKHISFVEMIARNSRKGTTVAVDIIEHLRKVIDLFDGATPKEDILSRTLITSDDLDEVLSVFHEFITTIVA